MTNQDKAQALDNLQRALARRREAHRQLRPNSFAAQGNAACISRSCETLDAMRLDLASERQYRYWLSHF